jgi:amino acid transporter
MILRSGGKRRRWGYAWVFLAPAIVALLFILLSLFGLGVDLPYWAVGDPKSTVIIALTMPMLVAYVIVRIYYWRRDARRAELMPTHVQNSENMK